MSATRNTTFKKPSYGTNEWCREVSAPSSWEKEVKHEALRGSGSAFLYYFLCKRTKKKPVCLTFRHHPTAYCTLTWPQVFFKSCFVASAFHQIACFWKAAIASLCRLFWKYPRSFGFFQHDSKLSAPIRIRGLMCFNTLPPFNRSVPTGSALPAWGRIRSAAATSSRMQRLRSHL